LAAPISIPVLHEDEHLIVVSKPSGLLSVPDLARRLHEQGLDAEPVHRLDRDVSGTLVCARDAGARERLQDLFREREVKKTYWALVQGPVIPAEGAHHFPIVEERGRARVSARGRKALTYYRTIAVYPTSTELEIDLVTGRYNQIRIHFAHAGTPLVGERKYARGKDAQVGFRSRRVALHAWRLELDHPITGERLSVEAPLPPDLENLRERALDD
jgi:RluA family pseudouridine synthase